MEIVAQWHSDNDHEWLQVSKADCDKLGLVEADFSHYSYKDASTFFLEGGADAMFFGIEAGKAGFTLKLAPTFNWWDRARIRDYPRMAGESRLWNAAMNKGAAQ